MRGHEDEPIVAVSRPAAADTAPAAQEPLPGRDSGVSPRIVWGGLAALLGIFALALWIVPDAVRQQPESSASTAATDEVAGTEPAAEPEPTTRDGDRIDDVIEFSEGGARRQRPDCGRP